MSSLEASSEINHEDQKTDREKLISRVQEFKEKVKEPSIHLASLHPEKLSDEALDLYARWEALFLRHNISNWYVLVSSKLTVLITQLSMMDANELQSFYSDIENIKIEISEFTQHSKETEAHAASEETGSVDDDYQFAGELQNKVSTLLLACGFVLQNPGAVQDKK